MEHKGVTRDMVRLMLQEEVIHAHLYGGVDTAYAMRRVAFNLGIELDQGHIESTIAQVIRDMRQADFIRWLDERQGRYKNGSS
jgi:hypothetical protein